MTKLLTEEDAATAYARAWNRLEPDGFLELLAPDAGYDSQWVFSSLNGAEEISDYLRGKMNTVRALGAEDLSARVQVELGHTTRGCEDRPCALIAQGGAEVKGVVLFEVADGRIKRFDMCIPALYGPVGSRVYPT